MSNFEYANATDAELEQWAFEAYEADQEAAYEERVVAAYHARGQGNLY